VQLPFIALNTATEFAKGANCGRWIEIRLGKNCAGGSNDNDNVCMGGCASLLL
jgi:hypothetical protein